MKELTFYTEEDLEKCRALWEQFSPRQTIYQEWDWRWAHYKYSKQPIKFLVGMDANQPIGILPLQYESEEGFWEFFGGQEVENNGVWVKPGYEDCTKQFLLAAPEPIWIDYLSGDNEFICSLFSDDFNYELALDNIKNADDFIENKLSGKLRKHVRASYHKILEMKPEIMRGNWEDLPKLYALNEAIFGEDSGVRDELTQKIYQELLQLPYNWHIISVYIGGKLRAASLSVFHRGVYYFYAVGYERGEIKDLNAFINLLNIDEAKKLNASKIDFGYHDCGWKERWGLTPVKYYEYWRGMEPELD